MVYIGVNFWILPNLCGSNRYPCPDHVNPAEFLADLISVDYSSSESINSCQKRINGLVETFSQQTASVIYATSLISEDKIIKGMKFGGKASSKSGGWWKEFMLLLKRAWMQVYIAGFTFLCGFIFFLKLS